MSGPFVNPSYWESASATLAEVRATSPACEVDLPEGGSGWLLTRYDDVRAAFADPRFSRDYRAGMAPEERFAAPELPFPIGDFMLLHDPPRHTRLRKLVAKEFTPRRVAGLRPSISAMTEALLDQLAVDRPVDLLAEFAIPLPMEVICQLLGVPMLDRAAFAAWSTTMIDDGSFEESHAATMAMAEYLRDLVERKRSEPDDALLTALINVSDDEERLSADEIAAMAMLLLIAGHETTATLITTAVAAMAEDHDLRDRLANADDETLREAIEEFLRWGSPIATTPMRYTTEDVALGDVVIPRGAMVMLSLLSANRDPDHFVRPDEYDPERQTDNHVAFGYGLHFCLGASLARLEAEIALRALLDRFPQITSAPGPGLQRRRSYLVHAWKSLPVNLVPPTGETEKPRFPGA